MTKRRTISLDAARGLLDLGSRMGDAHRAEEQLRGAVAIHNLLQRQSVAYLADEVGMGKTYVALGALALFRHFNPDFRVLVLSPRENIQLKWQKELSNFSRHNVRIDDLRMRSLDGRPPQPLVSCHNLNQLIQEVTLDPSRDVFARLSSFSLAMGKDAASDSWKRIRDGLRAHLPWLPSEVFDLRNKEAFKRNYARALCCALPVFDLVIVDEAHNLKHGRRSSAIRNQILAEAFGQASPAEPLNRKWFPNYGARARRVLFLSATPLEESYRHLWNQLDVFGMAGAFPDLDRDDVAEERKKQVASQFLIRRVTSIKVNGTDHTKNMYRREWRSGGVSAHDEPIAINDDRQRLVIALIQKKVSELLRDQRFNHSFQIGMLASFESFLETAKLKRSDDDAPVFDDAEQSLDQAEREGLDVADLNRLARDYRRRFGTELPHPKMDAVVDALAPAFQTGRKALIFVRRVASVKELKQKLDARYDEFLITSLRARLPPTLEPELDALFVRYREEQLARKPRNEPVPAGEPDDDTGQEDKDSGGIDTFFAWFFRGDGPRGVLSGANLQSRFVKSTGSLATFFADNHVMWLLDAAPGAVLNSLALRLGLSRADTEARLRDRATRYLGREARVTRAHRFRAAQAAALELLAERCDGDFGVIAHLVLHERYTPNQSPPESAPPEIAAALERPTFFTELRRSQWNALAQRIWPAQAALGNAEAFRKDFLDQTLRGEFLASAARLGHAFIDLYCVALSGRKTLTLGTQADDITDDNDHGAVQTDQGLIADYLGWLDQQRTTTGDRPWGAFDELAELADHFELILDVNAPELRETPPEEAARAVSRFLRQQQPVGGMSGQINRTLVGQFRMPGYPFVMITTDLLQEGEDLHTFCSSVLHYGISWTPSSMEQRTGRVDRVRSQTDRRLSGLQRDGQGEDWLQVYFPYLADTVEVLQVERVLDRMDTFIRLMHEGLDRRPSEQRTIDVRQGMIGTRKRESLPRQPLRSAFPIPDEATHGELDAPHAGEIGISLKARFQHLREVPLSGVRVEWEPHAPEGTLLGTARLSTGRIQPFTLRLSADHGHPVVLCISPIGRAHPGTNDDAILELAATLPLQARIGAILTREDRSYDLTIEDGVMLADAQFDAERVGRLVTRVTHDADLLEHHHFGAERDAAMPTFERDLRREGAP